MTSISSKTRKFFAVKKTVAAVLAVSTLGLATAPAYAGGGHHGHHGGHGHGGFGLGAGFGGGLLLGALIADNDRGRFHGGRRFARDCWFETRKRHDRFGDRYYVQVRVCD